MLLSIGFHPLTIGLATFTEKYRLTDN